VRQPVDLVSTAFSRACGFLGLLDPERPSAVYAHRSGIGSEAPSVPTAQKQSLLRSMNDEIASSATGVNPPDLHWVFACECGAPECTASVDLELPEYAEIAADRDRSVLAAGHVASPARRARREAAELRDSARALSGQAKLQRDRAQRLLG
jgi:hypothetical protein